MILLENKPVNNFPMETPEKPRQPVTKELSSIGEINSVTSSKIILLLTMALAAQAISSQAFGKDPIVPNYREYHENVSPELRLMAQAELRRRGEGAVYVENNGVVYEVSLSQGDIMMRDVVDDNRVLLPEELERVLTKIAFNKYQETPPPELENLKKKHGEKSAELTKLKKSIETTYGIKIVINDDEMMALRERGYLGRKFGIESIEEALKKLKTFLKKYPKSVLKKAGVKEVWIVRNLRQEVGQRKKLGGLATEEFLFLDIEDLEFSDDHELFHFLDRSDGFYKDNDAWARLNPNGEADYVYADGAQVPGSAYDAASGECGSLKKHFVTRYAYCAGADEDQADTAESIFSGDTDRLSHDPVLRNKVEMITGCVFDSTTNGFSRLLTKKEYRNRFGTKGYEYYPKWSNGKMGPKYWNAVIRGK